MRVVLIGGGGHASDILGAFEAAAAADGHPGHSVVGIVADTEVDPRRFAHRGVRQIGDLSDLKHIDASHYIVAIGYSQPRRDIQARVAPYGLEAATIIHPQAEVPPGVPVGQGSVVLGGAHVSPMAVIGHHVHLSYGCLIGHDCQVQDFVTVLPGAAVSGDTVLGEACLIGTNATVIEGRTIGREAIVGAGAVVLSDIPAGVTAVGIPAMVRPPKGP
jgi:sugar O-acyltransferase (sialic acid O-acetyltransferase NeuD family)